MKKIFKIFISILSNFFLEISSIFKIKEKNFVILICSYNNEDYIYQNLLSAVNQNYKNFEIIYINDLSTGKTEELFYSSSHNAYKILELEKGATPQEVKKAYRRMAKKFHPDKVQHLGPEHQKGAEEKFRKVQEAYEQLQKELNF